MATVEHVEIPPGNIHRPHNWEFASAGERAAAVITSPLLVGCIALQTDTGAYYRLSAAGNPATWEPVLTEHTHAAASETAPGMMTAAQFAKLRDIQAGATANSPDSYLLDRTKHQGQIPASVISDLPSAVSAIVGEVTPSGNVDGGSAATRGNLVVVRNDTAANWTSSNPTLATGEIGLETDTGLTKTGRGSLAWNALAYDAPPLVNTLTSTSTTAALTAAQGKALQDGKLDANKVGAADGVAPLNSSGLIPSQYLPAGVDEVIEVATYAALPATGVAGKLYIVLTGAEANRQYRWGGTAYVWLNQGASSTDVVTEGVSNKYFTEARVRGSVMTGYVKQAAADLAAGDTLMQQIGKLEGKVDAINAAAFGDGYGATWTAPTAGAETIVPAITMTGLRSQVVGVAASGPGNLRIPNIAGTGPKAGDICSIFITLGTTLPGDIEVGNASSPNIKWTGGKPPLPKVPGAAYDIELVWRGSYWGATAVTDAPDADAGTVAAVANLPAATSYPTGSRIRIAGLNYAEVVQIGGAWVTKGMQVIGGAPGTAATPLARVTMSTTARMGMLSFPVPMGIMKAGDRIVIEPIIDKGGTAGVWSMRCAINTTADGSNLTTNAVATKDLGATLDALTPRVVWQLSAKAGAASKWTTAGFDGGIADAGVTGAAVDFTFDSAVQQYIAFGTGLAGANGDTAALLGWIIYIIGA